MQILLIDDDLNLCKVLSYQLQNNGYNVETANLGNKGLALFNQKQFDIVITDLQMPDISGMDVLQKIRKSNNEVIIIIITAFGTVDNAIEACRKGANDYITKPFGQEQLLFTVNKAVKLKQLQNENKQLRNQLTDKYNFDKIISDNQKMKKIIQMSGQVAQTDSTVLILGESGTGKELFARGIHYNSKRKDKSLIIVNCPSIPATLLESELFGHIKGAFTGAEKDRIGKFEMANGSSIFLDEIGDLAEELQAKLLRVIQEQEIEKIGDSKSTKIDVRIIAATNKNLEKLVKENKFREDLYYRLSVVPLKIPALRERIDDIPNLIKHFIRKYSNGRNIEIDNRVIEKFKSYNWPGNIRELENLIERILIFLSGTKIKLTDLPESYFDLNNISENSEPDTFENIQKNAIIKAINIANGNKSKAAKILQIPRHVLLYRLKKFEIND